MTGTTGRKGGTWTLLFGIDDRGRGVDRRGNHAGDVFAVTDEKEVKRDALPLPKGLEFLKRFFQ